MKNPTPKILIAEDEEVMFQSLAERFTMEGFEVIGARDGASALSTALREQPDVVLLDIVLPKIDGMTVMERLRKTNLWGKRVPIVLLTNLTPDDKIIRQIVEHEPAYYLVKTSVSIDKVAEKVIESLGKTSLR